MFETITIFPIGQAPISFTVGVDDVGGFEISGTAGATWYVQVMYNDGTVLMFVGMPYSALSNPSV